MQIADAVLGVELDGDLVAQARGPAVQAARLDARHIRHDLELGVQRGAAAAAEEVLVDLAAGARGVPRLGRAGRDGEVGAWDHRVGRVCGSRPLLAVDAVAEG